MTLTLWHEPLPDGGAGRAFRPVEPSKTRSRQKKKRCRLASIAMAARCFSKASSLSDPYRSLRFAGFAGWATKIAIEASENPYRCHETRGLSSGVSRAGSAQLSEYEKQGCIEEHNAEAYWGCPNGDSRAMLGRGGPRGRTQNQERSEGQHKNKKGEEPPALCPRQRRGQRKSGGGHPYVFVQFLALPERWF